MDLEIGDTGFVDYELSAAEVREGTGEIVATLLLLDLCCIALEVDSQRNIEWTEMLSPLAISGQGTYNLNSRVKFLLPTHHEYTPSPHSEPKQEKSLNAISGMFTCWRVCNRPPCI